MRLLVGSNGRKGLLAASLFMALIQFYLLYTSFIIHEIDASEQNLDLSGGLTEISAQKDERCAIVFFGLPRAFESLVLPSIEKNIVQPNAAYQCDYYVQYFNLTEESPSRSGEGGYIDPGEIFQLKSSILKASNETQRDQTVAFAEDGQEDFLKQYTPLLQKIRTVKDSNGQLLYFPWKETSFNFETTDNIVKMWHNIQHAFQFMETYQQELNVAYTRVAMLRNDVLYVTPIDISWQPRQGVNDTVNRFAVVPGFAKYPVNDRMIIGPYNAVKIWATERFQRLEGHVQSILRNMPGYGMHSEHFLNYTIFPAIHATNTTIVEHDSMCFFRARADETVWISDCYLPDRSNRVEGVERILGRKCEGPPKWSPLMKIKCTKQP